MTTKIGLVGCVKSKRTSPARAADLYISPLFLGRRAYVESSCARWFILSAEHGLIDPDQVIAPYDVSLANASIPERRAWAERTLKDIEAALGADLADHTFEVHAGSAYRDFGFTAGLQRRGARVDVPAVGLTQGQQLAFYGGGLKRGSPASTKPPTDIEILNVEALEEFSFNWPHEPEIFELGWDFTVRADGQLYELRHGIGGRNVYGRFRVHTVTWLGKAPMVEGVAADDYLDTRALLSMARRADNKHVRTPQEMPEGYDDFTVVEFAREVSAPKSPRSLALKIAEDDLARWARHALVRAAQKGVRIAGGKPSAPKATPAVDIGPPPPVDEQAIVRDLLAFDAKIAGAESPQSRLTPNAEANDFVKSDPFAFLVAVIGDQGIKAERAWALPYELKKRLGYLDPASIAANADAVRAAFLQPPKLHRFVNGVAQWIVDAASIVLREYGGDAQLIWGDTPTAVELQRRLDRFPGIGQKKAAMAVEILARGLGTEIRDLGGSDIAYDVHVRRVFLRTGLAQRDEVGHMVEVARRLHPERPGALDLPAWVIGREWCHPTNPECGPCALSSSCGRLIERARGVRGV